MLTATLWTALLLATPADTCRLPSIAEWTNDAGSRMVLKVDADGMVRGTYVTALGCRAGEEQPLVGSCNGTALTFSVNFHGCGSTTAWTATVRQTDDGPRIQALWQRAVGEDPPAWDAVTAGSSTFRPPAVPITAGPTTAAPTTEEKTKAPEVDRPLAVLGPIFESFGPVFPIEDPDFPTPLDRPLRAVFDVAAAPEEPERRNSSLETVARFYNMHAQAGVAREHLNAAVVLHGAAGKAALSHAAYRARFGVDNPDLELVEALRAAGVRILLCGQSATWRGYARSDLAPSVELALSAMTALVTLQEEGYRLIAF